jgi:hypothetical protein
MNIFFYSAGNSACNNGCRYSKCSQRCLGSLKKIQALKDVTVLPGGSYFTTYRSMDIRSGDLMILYAGNAKELGELVENKEIFEAFRIILIVGDDQCVNDGRCHLLNPRYVASIGTDAEELNAVIEKMTGISQHHCNL